MEITLIICATIVILALLAVSVFVFMTNKLEEDAKLGVFGFIFLLIISTLVIASLKFDTSKLNNPSQITLTGEKK